MKPFEITDDIFILGGPEITDSRDGCVYLIHSQELILIDSGAGWSVDKILRNMEKIGFNPRNLGKILLTHCHIDHIGGVPEIKRRFGPKIYIHAMDAPPVEKGDPILTDAVQIFGGNGYVRGEYMVERIWRDLRVARVYDGSSEVQQIVIAQRLRKGDVETQYGTSER